MNGNVLYSGRKISDNVKKWVEDTLSDVDSDDSYVRDEGKLMLSSDGDTDSEISGRELVQELFVGVAVNRSGIVSTRTFSSISGENKPNLLQISPRHCRFTTRNR